MLSSIRKLRLPLILLIGILIIGVILTLGLRKTVTFDIDGSTQQVTTYALRVSDLLYSQGIALSPEDNLSPSLDTWLKNKQVITLVHAIPVQIFADGKISSILSSKREPAELLTEAGISIKSGDLLLSNGKPIDPGQALPLVKRSIALQLVRSVSFTLDDGGQAQQITSTSPSLGSALWSAGYSLFEADLLTPSVDVPLTSVMTATLLRSTPITIQTQFGDVSFRTAAGTVGDALTAAHLAPQGLDYSLPTSAEPIPSDRKVRLIRVSEQVLIEQTPIPFENEFQPASDLDLDSQAVLQPGENGLTAERVRVRYEDGQEVSRQADSQWVAREPQPRIIGYGTNVVMHTTTVDGETIQYWRALTMYATSYHPSEVGDTTASGLPLKKGVVAVDTSIIPFYTELYIPGYGRAIAADIGGGVHGRMIDLGYSDSDYVAWHSTVTVYFLWPPPDNIVWVIP
jgi:resuscitation-promoting factor RpfB